MAEDFGPVPVSRLKHEAASIFAALEEGRRVLISRSGNVVAAIEPASVERHAWQLANYAVSRSNAGFFELSATELGQGSPSRAVRAAQSGQTSLVTRNNKVFGVLSAPRAESSLEDVMASERVLAEFEQTYPESTPDEFASVAAKLDEAKTGNEVLVPQPTQAGTQEALIDALMVKASTLASAHNIEGAESTFLEVIKRFESYPGDQFQLGVARSMLALAKLYTQEDRADDALILVDQAVTRLEAI